MWRKVISEIESTSMNKFLHIRLVACAIVLIGAISSCKNREVNPENSITREIPIQHSPSHFQEITIGGIDYLILERDRNNPHEGFGFMAISGDQLIYRQDSIIAYQKAILENQARIISRLEGISINEANYQNQVLLQSKFFEMPVLPVDSTTTPVEE